jgi:hypothetical protein
MPNIYAQPIQSNIDDIILNNTIIDNDENNSMQSTNDSEGLEQFIINNTVSTSYDDENDSSNSIINSDNKQSSLNFSNQSQVE